MSVRRKNRLGRDPFVAYIACRCCGHWRPLTEKNFRCLIDPMHMQCPFCLQGRKRTCETWDGKTRRPPTPALLDVRVGAGL